MSQVVPPSTKQAIERPGISVGPHTYGVPTIHWWGEEITLTIGDYCSIADRVRIFLGGNHHTDCVTTYPFYKFVGWPDLNVVQLSKGDIHIGNDVWIGSGALILSGVTIGDGAILGAECVVAKDIPPYAIAVGNPARVVKKRFSDDIIQELLKIQWWNWPEELIAKLMPLLLSNNIPAFIEASYVFALAEAGM